MTTKRQVTQLMAQNILDNKELSSLRPLQGQLDAITKRADALDALLRAEIEKVRNIPPSLPLPLLPLLSHALTSHDCIIKYFLLHSSITHLNKESLIC